MKNHNCLKGMRCPECRSYGPFRIAATAEFEVHDSGTDSYSSVEWEESGTCICMDCRCTGKVLDFRIENQKANRRKK